MILICLQKTQSYSQSVFYRPPVDLHSHMIFVQYSDFTKEEKEITTYFDHMEKNFSISND